MSAVFELSLGVSALVGALMAQRFFSEAIEELPPEQRRLLKQGRWD